MKRHVNAERLVHDLQQDVLILAQFAVDSFALDERARVVANVAIEFVLADLQIAKHGCERMFALFCVKSNGAFVAGAAGAAASLEQWRPVGQQWFRSRRDRLVPPVSLRLAQRRPRKLIAGRQRRRCSELGGNVAVYVRFHSQGLLAIRFRKTGTTRKGSGGISVKRFHSFDRSHVARFDRRYSRPCGPNGYNSRWLEAGNSKSAPRAEPTGNIVVNRPFRWKGCLLCQIRSCK